MELRNVLLWSGLAALAYGAFMAASQPAEANIGPDDCTPTPPINPAGTEPMVYSQSAGQRNLENNNPGNLRVPGSVAFQTFPSMQAGIAAVVHQLNLYLGRGINTIAKMVSTYAPSSDGNNTASYTNFVSTKTGIPANQPLSASQIQTVAYAFITQEQGGVTPQELLTRSG